MQARDRGQHPKAVPLAERTLRACLLRVIHLYTCTFYGPWQVDDAHYGTITTTRAPLLGWFGVKWVWVEWWSAIRRKWFRNCRDMVGMDADGTFGTRGGILTKVLYRKRAIRRTDVRLFDCPFCVVSTVATWSASNRLGEPWR
jgi:hypothetical protein